MNIIDLVKSLPKEWVVFILSAIPIVEVRGAVPLGIYMGLAPIKTYVLAVLGSIVPVIPLIFFLAFFTEQLRKINIFDKFFEWLFTRTRKRSKVIEELEILGLLIFVAIPFPGTGVWTGCLAAYLFGLSYMKTFIACFFGTAIASLIMLLGSMGIVKIFF